MDRSEFEGLVRKLLESQKVKDVQDGLLRGSFIRAINYHSTCFRDIAKLDKELAWYSQNFTSVTVEDVDRYLDTGVWHKEKPGLILAVFEGFRNHYDVMYPLLEKHNLTGWFHIPAFYPDVPVAEQAGFGEAHELHANIEEYEDGRMAMNWDEIREIARKHVICCHSGTHYQIHLDTSDEDMEREIVQAKFHLEKQLGVECPVYCWLYGEEYSYNPKAAEYIQKAGYRYVVGNLKIERVKNLNKI